MSSDFASEFPTLARLALSDEQRQALRQGGFVALERRGPGKQVVKLRFRCGGRQHVRYLGTSAEVGEQARRELDRLQGDLHLARELRRQLRLARLALRAAKRESAPLLGQLGLAYHGFAIRRPHRGPRPRPIAANATANETANATQNDVDFNSSPKSKEDNQNVQ